MNTNEIILKAIQDNPELGHTALADKLAAELTLIGRQGAIMTHYAIRQRIQYLSKGLPKCARVVFKGKEYVAVFRDGKYYIP